MRQLVLIALASLALAACDGERRFDEPVMSNGNTLRPIDCAAAANKRDTVCVVGEDGEITSIEPDDGRHRPQPVEP